MQLPDVHQSVGSFQNLTTLLEVLYWRAQQQPHQLAYSFLTDGEADSDQITYAELDRRARAIAMLLYEANASGERVLLLYPPGIEYIAAFFGCLYAGAIAVPAYPPALNRTIPRIQAIATDSQTRIVLAGAHIIASIQRRLDHAPDLRALHWISTDDLPEHSATQWRPPTVASDSLAMLQYTSGSTSTPKGVMLTHGNLLENLRLIERCFEHTPASQGVIWLPPYHDMGLIGGILQPLYAGFPVTLMAPITFLQSPIRWLRAISQTRATTSGGPNFAYELCASRITAEQRDMLDLSNWDVAFVGAEPIRPQTLERFAAVFEPCGFRREAFYPCYGLAEATLIVSGGLKASLPVVESFAADALERHQAVAASDEHQARAMVGCGQAVADHRITIVDPQTLQPCASGTIGEIWVAGASVAQGYWGQPETTEQIFRARLSETESGPFLRTGDLGFIRHGELFVTGRLKDLIIIRGKNYYPHDIESTVEQSHPALSVAACAAFSIEADNQERLVIVQEVERQSRKQPLEPIIATIRQAVLEQHELQAYSVVLIKPGRLPKTSSGKIQRYACRQAFLQGTLEALTIDTLAGTSSEPGSIDGLQDLEQLSPEERQAALESHLQREVARVLGVTTAHVDVARPLNSFGLDSMMAVELQHSLESTLNVVLPLTSFLREISITDLARSLCDDFAEDTNPIEPGLSEAGTGEYPLSYGQRALWFLHQLEPTTAAYNIANAVRIRSEVDPGALQRAFERLVQRHAALRTTFAARHGEPFQIIHAQGSVEFQVSGPGHSVADLDAQLTAAAQRPFDLERGPLLRVHLFTRSDREHVLLLVVHHIVADLWSLDILTQELGTVYAAERAGYPVELAPLTLHYPDYVAWQSRLLLDHSGTRLWEYWQRQLGPEGTPAPLVLELPTDHPRPPVQTYIGATETFRLDETLTRQLKTLAQGNEATLYMVLLAAFQVLLYRYTGQEDLLVGSPTTGRSRRALAGLVGYLVNPIILRGNLAGNPSFRTFLGRVRETVLAALAHQDYPLSLLVERLQPSRDPSRSPLFQVMFVLQKAHLLDDAGLAMFALGADGAQMDLGGMTIEALSLKQNIAQFDLTLTMAETDTALVGALQYNTALFEPATIARMADHFQMLIADIIARPDQPIAELKLLTSAEQQTLHDWNATDVAAFREHTLLELLEAQAARTPDALAVVFDEQHLTYRELNRRANQLAHHLQRLGVHTETRVGICMERSLELVVGLVGILKAGGCYVPLDPTYPHERLQYMLADSETPVLLTQQHLVSELQLEATGQHAQVVCLDAGWSLIADEPGEPPAVRLAPLNSAYMIYTSGSTGKPKGAINTHAGICNRLLWMQATYRLSPEDRVLQKTPFSFDVSVWEFFWPLIVGAQLVVALPNGHLDPAYLVDVINRQRITTLHFVPSMLEVFLEAPECDTCTSIRQVICSGEALPIELQERFFTHLHADLHNLYGPTEAAVDVTFWPCTSSGGRRSVPIGRPVANTRIYLLDARLNPVPIGVPGELYIGGVQLARGYFNRPALTAERFVPDSVTATPGGRLYRTGDLARYHGDGAIEFLGRLDHQVKLRGFRIELGEIETTLLEHPAVRSCLVLAHTNTVGDTRLIAYVVPDERHAAQGTPRPDSEEQPSGVRWAQAGGELKAALRLHVQERLPDYMVPSAFVMLDEMPLLPSGKVNRAALPQAEITRPELEANFVAPRNPVEQTLTEIWAEVLGVKQIGVHDNFFALGGHSLLMAQIVARIRNTFKLEVPMRSFFQGPTVAELALFVTQNRVEQPPASTVERLLDQISNLSPEQIRALLAAKQAANPGATAAPTAQPAPIEQPLPATIAAAPVDERYTSVAFKHFPAGDGLELVYTASDSQPHVLASELVAVLEHCRQFKTLDDHVAAISGMAEDPSARALRRSQLEELRSAGLLIRERELRERLAQGAPTRQPIQIAAVAWPTCNRVELLQRSLVSYIENCRRYGRAPDFVIMDDSPDPATCRAYQAMLTRVQREHGAAILYGGQAEKIDFTKHMLATDTLPPEVLQFALFGDPRATHSYGRNINAILLHTTGDVIISADDDTVAQVMPSPEHSDGMSLLSGRSTAGGIKLNAGDPDAVWTFPDRETLLRQARFVDTDLLGLHEQLLGQAVRHATADVIAAGQPLVLDDAHANLLHALQSHGGQVLITLPGLIGDCGWGTPSHYLSLTGSSLQRLLSSEETYRHAGLSRELLRVAPRLTLVDKVTNMIGATYGLDNRQIIPPSVPIAIGQDNIFGDTLAQCYDHSYCAHLPWAVLHLPDDARSFWPGEIIRSASGLSFNTLLSALINQFDPGLSRADGPVKLRRLGRYLSELASLPRHEFAAAIRIAVGHRAGLYLQMLQAQMEGPDLPAFWVHDIRQFSATLRESLLKDTFYVPLDLLYGRDVDTAWALTQQFVGSIGQLYQWWPDLIRRAKQLREQNIRLAKHV